MKVTGEEEWGGKHRADSPPPISSAHLLPFLSGAPLPGFWGSVQPPDDSQMCLSGPHLLPSVPAVLFCPPPNM